MMARAVPASCAWLLCWVLCLATPADARHTKPHQEAVQAARSALFDRKDPGLALRHLDGMWMNSPTDTAARYLLGLAHVLLYHPALARSPFDACLSVADSAPR